MECELCGKKAEHPRKASVEGAILTVCDNCVNFGTEVQFSRPRTPAPVESQQSFYTAPVRKVKIPYSQEIESGDELVEDYGKIIQREWQRSGKKLEEFAAMLNEKSSVISKLISGSMVPDDKLVKKLERVLKIKLREPSSV